MPAYRKVGVVEAPGCSMPIVAALACVAKGGVVVYAAGQCELTTLEVSAKSPAGYPGLPPPGVQPPRVPPADFKPTPLKRGWHKALVEPDIVVVSYVPSHDVPQDFLDDISGNMRASPPAGLAIVADSAWFDAAVLRHICRDLVYLGLDSDCRAILDGSAREPMKHIVRLPPLTPQAATAVLSSPRPGVWYQGGWRPVDMPRRLRGKAHLFRTVFAVAFLIATQVWDENGPSAVQFATAVATAN